MSFDRSCIYPFRLDSDTDLIVALDARIVAEAAQGLTPAQKTTLSGFRWTPNAAQLASGQVPQWAGNDPPTIYFKAPDATIKAALAKRYRAAQAGDPVEVVDKFSTAAVASQSQAA